MHNFAIKTQRTSLKPEQVRKTKEHNRVSQRTRLYDHYPREKFYHRAGYYVHKVSVHLGLD